MTALAKRISAAGLSSRILDERQLAELVGGTAARRYGLVNRAIKDGALIRVKRGKYVLSAEDRADPVHPFAVAQSLLPGSYVSFETALAYHGWIPETVFTTASVSPGRKTIKHETDTFGSFAFHPLAIHDYHLLTGVDRTSLGKLTALVAQPLRAILDLVALRKQAWEGLDWLTSGMRIDEAHLFGLKRHDFAALKPVYKHKAVNAFLAQLEVALMSGKTSQQRSAKHD
jgi:predicted transcriptional regulator of viral defense system